MDKTNELAHAILGRVSNGESLRAICRDMQLPESTVRDWLASDEWAAHSLRARESGCDALAEQALEIADTPVEGTETKVSETGLEVKTADMLGHRRLQIDTRLRLLGKWSQRYSDKVTAEITGKNGGPLSVLLGQLGKSALPVKGDE